MGMLHQWKTKKKHSKIIRLKPSVTFHFAGQVNFIYLCKIVEDKNFIRIQKKNVKCQIHDF